MVLHSDLQKTSLSTHKRFGEETLWRDSRQTHLRFGHLAIDGPEGIIKGLL